MSKLLFCLSKGTEVLQFRRVPSPDCQRGQVSSRMAELQPLFAHCLRSLHKLLRDVSSEK